MDERMGRRTVGGLLCTRGGSILVFRDEHSSRRTTTCCSRLACSSKSFCDKERRIQHQMKEAITSRSSTRPSSAFSFGKSSIRRGANMGKESESTQRRETPARDLLTRLKERVNASRKRSLSGEGSSSSARSTSSSSNGSNPGSSSSSHSTSRQILGVDSTQRQASRTRREDRAQRDHTGNTRTNASEKSDHELFLERIRDRGHADDVLPGNLLRHGSSLLGGPSSYLQPSLEDENRYWRFDMAGREEFEEYFFGDRHRGMRMDIDDMSYEELLALGERIGTVNTGLSEEALSKCLKRSLYVPTTSVSEVATLEDGDIKCIVCQEEYILGDEVDKMGCEHYFHADCIHQWLQLKKWCPICKACASSIQ